MNLLRFTEKSILRTQFRFFLENIRFDNIIEWICIRWVYLAWKSKHIPCKYNAWLLEMYAFTVCERTYTSYFERDTKWKSIESCECSWMARMLETRITAHIHLSMRWILEILHSKLFHTHVQRAHRTKLIWVVCLRENSIGMLVVLLSHCSCGKCASIIYVI